MAELTYTLGEHPQIKEFLSVLEHNNLQKQKFLFHKVPPFLITAHNQADFLMQKYPGSIRGI